MFRVSGPYAPGVPGTIEMATILVVEDELRLDGGFVGDCDTARGSLVEVTEVFVFQGWGLAGVSGDLDEGAAWGVF